MKTTLFLALALWLSPSFAAESQTTLIRPDAGTRWEVSVGSGLGLFDGQVGWGLDMGVARGGGIPTPFWMGLDLAIYRWDYDAGQDPLKPFAFSPVSSGATFVQILPTFLWDFPLLAWPGLVPYVGLSVGPAVYLADGNHAQGPNVYGAHETLVGLAAYLRPGLRAALAPSLNLVLEGKLGLFRSRPVFLPQFALAWAP
jgi:hypothetical protein